MNTTDNLTTSSQFTFIVQFHVLSYVKCNEMFTSVVFSSVTMVTITIVTIR